MDALPTGRCVSAHHTLLLIGFVFAHLAHRLRSKVEVESMSNVKWGEEVSEGERRDQLKLVYDYIKFHIGLYIGTPAALSIVADTLEVKRSGYFIGGLAVAIIVYIIAGIHAGLFMSQQINDPWQSDYLKKFEDRAFSPRRRFMHHSLYWFGLVALTIGLIAGAVQRLLRVQ